MNNSDLMTPEEVHLALQIAALDICIEHWRENQAFFKEHRILPWSSIKWSTCALCYANRNRDGEIGCATCLLQIETGMYCDDDDSIWHKIRNGLADMMEEGMQEMIDTLEKIEHDHEPVKVSVYCGMNIGLPPIVAGETQEECTWSTTIEMFNWEWERDPPAVECGGCKAKLDHQHMEVKT